MGGCLRTVGWVVVLEYKNNILLTWLTRGRLQILWSFLRLYRIKTEIWLYFIIVISTPAPLHPWRRLVVIMHLVPAPVITDLCGEDYKKLFGLLPSPRSPTNDFQESHQFLWLVSQEGCWNLHEGDTLKRFFCRHLFLAKLWLLGGKRSHHTNLVRDFSRNSQTHAELR